MFWDAKTSRSARCYFVVPPHSILLCRCLSIISSVYWLCAPANIASLPKLGTWSRLQIALVILPAMDSRYFSVLLSLSQALNSLFTLLECMHIGFALLAFSPAVWRQYRYKIDSLPLRQVVPLSLIGFPWIFEPFGLLDKIFILEEGLFDPSKKIACHTSCSSGYCRIKY